MMVKLEMIFGTFQAIWFTVITWNPGSNCPCPREESFPIPLKCIDVTKTTDTSLDVLLEKASMTIGTLMEVVNCQIHRQVFTRFTLKSEKPPDGYTWSGKRLTRKQTTSRPDTLSPEMWKHMSDASKRKEEQKWAIEKPKLDNARRLRGIYFIDPGDKDFTDTM